MEIPFLGPLNFQFALAEVEQKFKTMIQPHLYSKYRPYYDFESMGFLGKGKYGRVEKVKDKKNDIAYAWKKIRFQKEKLIPGSVQREIDMLRNLKHENIVVFYEIVGGPSTDIIYLLMEYCESTLAQVMEGMDIAFVQTEAKCILLHMFKALMYIHERGIVHGDINPSNILLKDCSVVKICDFSSSHEEKLKPKTPCAGNLWYRAPESIFGSDCTTAIDVWACGCIFAELLTLRALFPGKNEMHQITLIIDMLGTPSEETMPGFSDLPLIKKFGLKIQPYSYLSKKFKNLLKPSGIDILGSMLIYSPVLRITSKECFNDNYFKEEPQACSLQNLKCGIIHKTNKSFVLHR